jgi:hypothetical protein
MNDEWNEYPQYLRLNLLAEGFIFLPCIDTLVHAAPFFYLRGWRIFNVPPEKGHHPFGDRVTR